jgi:hypothetical protein
MVDIVSRLFFFIRSRTRLRRWGQTGLFLDSYPLKMVGLLSSLVSFAWSSTLEDLNPFDIIFIRESPIVPVLKLRRRYFTRQVNFRY